MVELKDQYPNSPLMEVAWEIRFPTQLIISQIGHKFQNMVKSDYPEVKEVNQMEFQFEMIKGTSNRKIVGQHSEFHDKEGLGTIRLRNNRFAVINRNYTNYDELRNEIKKQKNNFSKLFKDDIDFPLTRIGLRYINFCKIPGNDLNSFDVYYNTPLSDYFNNFNEIHEFNMRIIEKHQDNIKLTTNYTLAENQGEIGVLIDFDSFVDIEIDFEDIIDITNNLHDVIKNKFKQLITQEYVNKIMEVV